MSPTAPSAAVERDDTGGATSGWLRGRLPDLVLVVMGLCLLPYALRLPWESDLGLHLAVLGRLEHSLVHPGNPVLAVGGGSAYYSPYMVVLAALGKLVGASAFGMFKFAGICNIVLLLTGMRAFTRALTPRRWAPVLAMLMLVLLWGYQPLAWSGFLSGLSLAVCLAYPSTFAFGLTLHIWALAARATGRGPRGLNAAMYLVTGVLAAVVLLSHQFTFVETMIGLVALVGSRFRSVDRAQAARWLVAAVAALVVIAAWPYYHVWSLLGSVGNLDSVHEKLYAVAWYVLGIVALPALYARWRRDRLDPLVLLFVLAGVVVLYGEVTGKYAWGRTFPALMLPLQLALAIELAGEASRLTRNVLVAPTVVALLVGVKAQAGAVFLLTSTSHVPRAVVRHVDRVVPLGRYSWITRHVGRGQVVLTDDRYAELMVPAYGPYLVAEHWYDPSLSEAAQASRWHAADTFFARGESASAARATLRDYHVEWIIATPATVLPPGFSATRVATGPHHEVLYRVAGA